MGGRGAVGLFFSIKLLSRDFKWPNPLISWKKPLTYHEKDVYPVSDTGGSEEKKRALTVLRVPAGVLQLSSLDGETLVQIIRSLYMSHNCIYFAIAIATAFK